MVIGHLAVCSPWLKPAFKLICKNSGLFFFKVPSKYPELPMHSLIESLFFPFELSVFYHIFLVMRSVSWKTSGLAKVSYLVMTKLENEVQVISSQTVLLPSDYFSDVLLVTRTM